MTKKLGVGWNRKSNPGMKSSGLSAGPIRPAQVEARLPHILAQVGRVACYGGGGSWAACARSCLGQGWRGLFVAQQSINRK